MIGRKIIGAKQGREGEILNIFTPSKVANYRTPSWQKKKKIALPADKGALRRDVSFHQSSNY